MEYILIILKAGPLKQKCKWNLTGKKICPILWEKLNWATLNNFIHCIIIRITSFNKTWHA